MEGFISDRRKIHCPADDFCDVVDFISIDRWLAAPRRGFDGGVNFSLEELLQVFKSELYDLEDAVLKANPRL